MFSDRLVTKFMMCDILSNSFEDIHKFYDEILNKDKSTYKSSNDEPTPMGCIVEMMQKVPVDFWKNTDLKILDPCCGNGNFHLVLLQMLLENGGGHDKKSITENILHFNDINKDRLDNVEKIFRKDLFNLNISRHDFLQHDYEGASFDMIVANPPYAHILDNGKRASKNHNLIQSFLKKSLGLLKHGGFLVFITPDNWMSCADRNEIVKTLTSLRILHLNIHTAKKYFKKIGSSFTWYVVQNMCHSLDDGKDIFVEGLYKKTEFSGYVKSGVRDYIPLLYTDVVRNILEKTIDNTCIPKYLVETCSDLHKYTKSSLLCVDKDDVYRHKIIHTPKQTVWSSRPHKYQDGWKVFLSTTDKYNVFVDNCGMTQSIAFIRCSSFEQAEKIKSSLQHPLYKFLNDICRWGNFNNVRILQRFPVCNEGMDAFMCFGLDEVEKNYILSHLA